MKALALTSYGAPEDAFTYQDFKNPVLSDSEVLIKVEACALNHLDLWMRQGKPRVASLPHIIGSDVAGVIVDMGSAVMGFKTGMKVMVQPGLSCMMCDECATGNHNACDHYSTFGILEHGGYAELMKAPAANIVRMPEGLSFTEAASLPLVLTTTHHMIVTNGKLQRGETVLVQGANSGVGSIGLQLVKALGGKVIAVASSAEKCDQAKQIGADFTINSSNEDITFKVKEFTNGKGVDMSVEHVGISTFASSVASLKKGGRVVSCGATTLGAYPLDLTKLFWLRQSIIGSRMGRKDDLIRGLKHVESGAITPIVAAEFALKDGAAAHEALGSRKLFGKVVLRN